MWCPVHAIDAEVCHHCLAHAVEVPALRKAHERHYRLPSGRMVADISVNAPLHWRGPNGRWRDYEPAWTAADGGWGLGGMPFGCRVEGTRLRLWDDEDEFTGELLAPALRCAPVAVGPRLFWEPDEHLTVYIKAHRYGLGTHYILRSPRAPREFAWEFTGTPPWGPPSGRDNLDRRPGRRDVDTTRILEVEAARTEGRLTLRWTGRVKALDTLRRRSYSQDAVYPVRVRH